MNGCWVFQWYNGSALENESLLAHLSLCLQNVVSHGELEIFSEILYFIRVSLLESSGIKTSMDTRFVGMVEGAKRNFSLKPVICITYNKGIIASLIIIEPFLIGV